MWVLGHKEGIALKNWYFWTVVFGKTLESTLDCKEINQSILKEISPCWSWSSNILASWCEEMTYWKRPYAWKDFKQKEKGMTEDEMVGWHHWLDGHEFEQALGIGDGQGSLACCSPWGHQEAKHDWAAELNWLTILHDEIKKCTRVLAALHLLQNLNLIW